MKNATFRQNLAVLFFVLAVLAGQSAHADDVDPEYRLYPLPPDVSSSESYPVIGSSVGVSVMQTGASSLTIPIDVPDGVGGMVPQLSISYNSMSGNGMLGLGFGLHGLSTITRTPRDIYHDRYASGMSYNERDALRLDGKRLVAKTGGTMSDGAVFVPEDSPFTEIIQHGTGKDTWFEGRLTDGRTVYYGGTADSRQTLTTPSGKTFVNSWHISRVEDANGNYMTYSYLLDANCLYPLSISYGSNVHTGSKTLNTVSFYYRQRKDECPFVVNGVQGKMSNCLSDIVSKSGDAVYRHVILDYGWFRGMQPLRLCGVTVVDGNGNKQKPIDIGWEAFPDFLPSAKVLDTGDTEIPFTEREKRKFLAGDINGDGISDIVEIASVVTKSGSSKSYSNYCIPYLSHANSDGTVSHHKSTHIDIGSGFKMGKWSLYGGSPMLADMNGDGIQDIVIPYYDSMSGKRLLNLDIFRGSPGGLSLGNASGVSVELVNDRDLPLCACADFDNDGRNEVLVVETTKGKTGMNVCQLVPYAETGESIAPHYFNTVFNFTPKQLFVADFNGDGLTDFMVVHDKGCYTYLNSGSGFSYSGNPQPIADTAVKSSDLIDMGDFNGDGIPDFVMFSDSKIIIALGNGDGHFTQCAQKIDGIDRNGFDSKLAQTLVYDFDNDGRSDLVMVKAGKTKGHTFWLHSKGTSLEFERDVFTSRRDDSTAGHFCLGDFNGDGHVELMNYGHDSWNCSDTTEPTMRYYPNAISPASGKVRSITDSFGNTAKFSYKSLSTGGLYKKNVAVAKYPVADITAPLGVVSSLTRSNGASGTNTTEYLYEDLLVHLQGKGLLGMTTFSATNNVLGVSHMEKIEEWDNECFFPRLTTQKNIVGDGTECITTQTKTIGKWNKSCLSYPEKTETIDADGNKIVKTRSIDPEYGYLKEMRTLYDDGSYDAQEYGGYVKRGWKWLAGEITERKKHADDDAEYSDLTRFEYDKCGNVEKESRHVSTAKELTKTTLSHDGYGNVTASVISGDGVAEVRECREYDQTGRYVTKSYTIPETIRMTYSYDEFGNLLAETDETIADKNLTTTYEYDSWGVVRRTTSPTGACVKTAYGWGTEDSRKYYKLTYCLGQPWTKTWYDACGRIVATETVADGGVLETIESSFDGNGLEVSVTRNIGKLSETTTKSYDRRGRIVSCVSTTGKSATYSYDRRSATVTDGGRSVTKIYDTHGNLRKVIDPVSTLEYRYFSSGSPSEVSCGANTIRMQYDEAGNRTSLDDPDAGVTESEYNAEGKIVYQKDGRGTQKTFRYDSLGRLISSTGALTSVYYSYDRHGNVISEEHDNCSITNVYDKYNRLTAEIRNYNDGEEQLHKFRYDKFGNVTEETFPGGLIVSHVYDAYGNDAALVVGGDTVWAVRSDDGKTVTEAIYGGRLTHVRKSDDSGLLSSLSLMDGDRSLRSIRYKYDARTGNLKRRDGMKIAEAESFVYDSMDRLTASRIEPGLVIGDSIGKLYPDTSLVQVHGAVLPSRPGMDGDILFGTDKYKYSDDGNIIESSSMGSYAYCANRHHAVESVGNPRNVLPASEQDVYYNDIGKVDGIMEKGDDGELYLDFYYGPDDERWVTRLTKDNKPVRTIHFGSDYEKVDDDGISREFSYLGNDLLYYRENGGEGKLLYMFTDSQGSVTNIYDCYGNTLFSAEYDPWGNMKVMKNEIGFIRGYTGHEMLASFGLINMNGRLYDQKLGRFLSPDSYVQMPDNSQSFNRYSYCLNNPLKYTDPSGDYAVADDMFLFLVGGTFNLAYGLASGEVHGFWHGTELFLMGGVAGVLAEYGGPTISALVLGAGNSIINQGNANGWGNISWSEVATSTIMSGLTSAMGEYLAMNFSSMVNSLMPKVSNELLQNMLNQGATNGLTGFVLGSAMTLSTGGDLGDALKSGGMDGLGGAVTGAINGAAFEIRTARSERRSPWTGEKTNGHHSYPKFLGGDVNQELTTMSVSRHRQLHKDLNEYLYQQRDEFGNHMRPQRNNSGKRIEYNFDDVTRFNVTKTFYDKHSLKYWDAKFDFYKTNNIIRYWRPWR